MKEKTLPVRAFADRLGELKRTPEAVGAFDKNPKEITHLFVDGFNELIETFNQLKTDDVVLEIMPGTKALKNVLGNTNLPEIGKLPTKSIVRGLYEAKEAMVYGEKEKEAGRKPERRGILIASSEAQPKALFVGSAGHFLERTYFDLLRKQGINGIDGEWQKDEILFALEECIVMSHVKNKLGENANEPILIGVLAKPMSDGGTGWRKQEHLDKFEKEYVELGK